MLPTTRARPKETSARMNSRARRDSALQLTRSAFVGCASALLAALGIQSAVTQSDATSSRDPLLSSFASPPNAAKPRVWWHWMNGNVTEEGIDADLTWMNRVGIGGAHFFEAGGPIATYKFIEPRRVSDNDHWRAAIRRAALLADRFGMELTTAASPGWSVTGGPWVTPAEAMKKYVWSEIIIDGGRRFRGKLPQPPDTAGPFQNALPRPQFGQAPDTNLPRFYADSRLIAYRLPRAEHESASATPIITTSSGPIDVDLLADGDFTRSVEIAAAAEGELPWIQFEYSIPQAIRGVRLGIDGEYPEGARVFELLASDDGITWRSEAKLTGPASAVLKSYGFATVEARYFRLLLHAPPPSDLSFVGLPPPGPLAGVMKVGVGELSLERAGTVDRFAEKAGFTQPLDYNAMPTMSADADAIVRLRDVVDVTDRLQPDGTLDWTPPRGRWRIIRFGYSLTGAKNHPAPPEATGLEVDKLNPAHVQRYIDRYLARFEKALGRDLIGRRGLQSLLVDSWEAGAQNWTENLPAEFKARRGYDMTPWLPVLTGRMVESASESDKFLWDFRRTLQDLLAEHYRTLAEGARARGLHIYSEAQGDTWRALGDGMEMKRHADIPTAEYWFRTFAAGPGQPTLKADMKEAVSVANVYGKPFAAAESLTVFAPKEPWGFSPAKLKPVIDEIFAYGINRILIHTSVHQPLMDKAPGLTLGPFGQYFNRNETWAGQAGPFVDYVARSSHLLQQGRRIVDVAYFYGEDKPLVALFAGGYDAERDRLRIEVPDGYDYDFVNGAALREELEVSADGLSTRSGATYRVLFMARHVEALTLPTVRKLRELVERGAVLVGAPIKGALGRSASDEDVLAEARKIWGDAPGVSGFRTVGRGRVYWGMALSDVLTAENVPPDVDLGRSQPDTHVVAVHRRTDDGVDIYFLTNRLARSERLEISFRIKGKAAELWRAEDGSAKPVTYRVVGNRTVVPLELGPHDAVFVVFRRSTDALAYTAPEIVTTELARIGGPFELEFPGDRGAPERVVLPALMSWSEHEHPGVRYFSGTAKYTKVIDVPRDWLVRNDRLILDLGQVHEIAEVSINGRAIGVLWKAPYEIEVTEALRPGANTLTIAVTNLWPNRLIGDAQPGIERKYTWTAVDLDPKRRGEVSMLMKLIGEGWSADSPLLPSGLLGPVRIERRVPQL